jgi:hypothetical protein
VPAGLFASAATSRQRQGNKSRCRWRRTGVVAIEDAAVQALGDDVEDIGRPDLEVLRASETKNCDLLIEIGGRMDEVRESCHKVF